MDNNFNIITSWWYYHVSVRGGSLKMLRRNKGHLTQHFKTPMILEPNCRYVKKIMRYRGRKVKD